MDTQNGGLLPPQHTMTDGAGGGSHGYMPTLPPDHFDGREHGRQGSRQREKDSGTSGYSGMQPKQASRSSHESGPPSRGDQGRQPADSRTSSRPDDRRRHQYQPSDDSSRHAARPQRRLSEDSGSVVVDDHADAGQRPVPAGRRRSDRSENSLGVTQTAAARHAASAGSSVSQRMHPGAAGGRIAGGRLRLRVLRAFNLRNTDLGIHEGDVSDPFVVARLGRQEFKTEVVENNLNPVWDAPQFEFAIAQETDRLELEVFNANQWHADSLGRLVVAPGHLTPGETHCVREELDEGEGVVRDRGVVAMLEVELTFLSPEEVAAGALGAGRAPAGAAQLQLARAREHRAPNWVPLPSFQGLGPEVYERPSRNPLEEINAVAVQRRMLGYESMACRLGQYDYSSDPLYYPKQDNVDKRRWKDDPFYGWRQELQKTEHNLAPRGLSQDLDERRDEEDLQIWAKDPFHGWLHHDDAGVPEQGGEERSRLELEARISRQLVSLPSFHDADPKRFDGHTDYVDLHKAERRRRTAGADGRPAFAGGPSQSWRDDAFFGWLPGRGPDAEGKHQLHRPLEQARLKRLPSFSEQAALGITGHGIGLLRVWINGAAGLRYDAMSGLRGKPSSCVKVKVGSKEQLTATVSADSDPRWNSPVMTFEVESRASTLTLEVWDIVSNQQHFLGRLELGLRDAVIEPEPGHDRSERRGDPRDRRRSGQPRHERHDRDRDRDSESHDGPDQAHRPLHFRRELGGLHHHAELDFSCLYEPFDTEVSHPSRQPLCDGRPEARQRPRQQRPHDSHRPERDSTGSRALAGRGHSLHSNASSAGDKIGVLSVRVVAAYNLVNMDSGYLGDVSDPYVNVRLRSQGDRIKPKRTQTVYNNLDPVWNTSPFLFELMQEDDELLLEVFDEDMLTSDDFLGRMAIPLLRIVCGQPDTAVRIRDRLQDIDHGELEVEIGFSPG
mmetsp:Transcript_118164/g.312323  ORF Transcript_118164/g.312323 Transcript_118164/m.312323 type:complete len:952 (+) Transcript_118164:1745-4600(+)